MPGRTYNGNGYKYGLNGMLKDDEIAGSGNIYSAEFWEYDSRTGKRWNTDPVVKPWESPYACFRNNPIYYSDPSGLDGEGPNGECPEDGAGHQTRDNSPKTFPTRDNPFLSRGGSSSETNGEGTSSNQRKAPDFSLNLGNIVGTRTKPWILPLYQSQSVTYYNTRPQNNGFAPSEPDYTVLMQGRILNNLQWAYYQGKQKIEPLASGIKPEAPSFSEIGLLYRLMSRDLNNWLNISIDVGAMGGLTFAEVFFADGSGNTITEPSLVITNPFGNQRYSNIGKSGSLISKISAETIYGFSMFVLINAHHYQGTVLNTSIGNQQIPQLGTSAVTIGGSFTIRGRKK
jgi:hypothetical protein